LDAQVYGLKVPPPMPWHMIFWVKYNIRLLIWLRKSTQDAMLVKALDHKMFVLD
jgi:hypothetical protein